MLMQVELIKKATDDGLFEFQDHVPLGHRYLVELDSKQTITLLNDKTGGCHVKEFIYTIDGLLLPMECLRFVVH